MVAGGGPASGLNRGLRGRRAQHPCAVSTPPSASTQSSPARERQRGLAGHRADHDGARVGGQAISKRTAQAARATRGRAGRPPGLSGGAWPAKELWRPHGGERRKPLCPARRGGRSARTQWRRQDDRLLHHHRPDQGRPRSNRARRPRRDPSSDVPARAAGHRLSATGSIDFSRPQRGGQYPRRARGGGAEPSPARSRSQGIARRVRDHAPSQDARRSPCRAGSAAAWRSPARSPAGRITCCSTSRSRASIPRRWSRFKGWFGV